MDRATQIVWGLVILLVLLIVGGGVLAWNSVPSLDDQFCLANDHLPGHVVVLVDQTDSLTPGQVSDLEDEVHYLEKSLARYERLSIFTIGDQVQLPPLPIFSLCNPGRRDQVDAWTETASQHAEQFNSKFGQPLDQVLAQFLNKDHTDDSPIIGTIESLVSLDDFGPGVANRHLIIFSDLIEHSDLVNQYAPTPTYEQLERKVGADALNADLKGVLVDIFYLPRPEARHAQGMAHRRFWTSFFRSNGASAVRWCGVGNATRAMETLVCERVSNF